MRKLQCSRIAKACAIVLLLACSYAAGLFGLYALQYTDSVFSDNWKNTGAVWKALQERIFEIEEGVNIYVNLLERKQLEKTGGGGIGNQEDMAYLQERLDDMQERFSRENTWFRFRLTNDDGTRLLDTNLVEGESFLRLVKGAHTKTFTAGTAELWGGAATDNPENPGEQSYGFVLQYGLPDEVSEEVPDEFYAAFVNYDIGKHEFDVCLTGFLNLGAVAFLAMLYLLWACGHKPGDEDIVLTWQEKIFLDFYLFGMFWAAFFLCACVVFLGESIVRNYNPELTDFLQVGLGASCAALAGVITLSLRTTIVRIKAKALVRTTLLCRVVRWTVRTVQRTVYEYVRNLPFIWRVLAAFGVYILFTFFVLETWEGITAFLWLLVNVVVFLWLGWWAIGLHRLREGTRAITSGDLDHKIDTKYMPLDLRVHAEDLNNISVGMHSAVEEQMKSERFKAELITNVSHDLKTPLTSIINYVNLLKTTEQTDPKAVEYIEVLDRKSLRLKKLTEDLVEASKASTGVLSVNREKIGMCQLLDQALGEYGEKLEARQLSVIRTIPEEEVYVYADGRHLWRVIDNLLANCAKYAMEGTRVYVEVSRGQGRGTFQVKNISKEPLNVPAEQLMERFVRGDSSRSTEGSGLGLSIARSLTELQAGIFELAVDGDLFKAEVTLPQYGG